MVISSGERGHLRRRWAAQWAAILLVSATARAAAGFLSGCIVDENGDPLNGCVVRLVNAGGNDTTENGLFGFTDLPDRGSAGGRDGQNVPATGGADVTIEVFDMVGKRVRYGTPDKALPGIMKKGRSPLQLANGVYVITARNGSKSVTKKSLVFAGKYIGTGIEFPEDAACAPLQPAAVESVIDTLFIASPDKRCKRVTISRYHGSLGTITLTAAPRFSIDEIVFATRSGNPCKDGHWYANFGYYCHDPNEKAYGSQGRLCKVNLQTKTVTKLIDDTDGTVRDPQVSYDGTKILFSYRKGNSGYFHLYEIGVHGSGLRQITDGPYSDIEPTYLPDGGIAFCSSRANRWVNCWLVQVATVYRCDSNGNNIRMLSPNIEQDNTPWPLPDGRLLYTRWEYVDRSQMCYHHLWNMKPDGTGQMVYFGNYWPGNVLIDAKPIPGTDNVVCINSPGHGAAEHEGRVSILTDALGPDNKNSETIISGSGYRDPYPLSGDSIIVAAGTDIILMNGKGQTQTLFSLPSDLKANGACLHEPRPVCPRPKESVIAPKVNLHDSMGTLLVLDTYIGRTMDGVKKGDITKLLILETLPKPANFGGQMETMSWGGTFTMNRILGTVPVESDGSCYMELPAGRGFFFVALDKDDFSVKRMQSFLCVMPGERGMCIGCHEERTMAVPNIPSPQAMKHPPLRPQPLQNMPEVFDYPRDIQPIWDRHCLGCHDVDKHAGGVYMTGDNGPLFTLSYFELSARLQMADGRDMNKSEYPPRKIGSGASPLMKKIDGSHHGVNPTPEELRKVKLWIDASAHFPGTYSGLEWGGIGVYLKNTCQRPDLEWPSLKKAQDVMQRTCAGCHEGGTRLPTSASDNLGIDASITAYNGNGAGWDASYTPPWLSNDADYITNVGSTAWMKRYADPRLQFNRDRIYNVSRPDKSLLLLAPLAKSAGGYEACGKAVFTDTSDSDYRLLLDYIKQCKSYLDSITRFNMPVYRPRPEYIREMIKLGFLPPTHKWEDPINVYETDKKYWESMWWNPESATGILDKPE